jgi:hypothetical protein
MSFFARVKVVDQEGAKIPRIKFESGINNSQRNQKNELD